MSNPVTLYGIDGLPEVRAGDDLAGLLLDAAGRQGVGLEDGDVLVVTQKVVSKAEGRVVDLRGVAPSALAVPSSPRSGRRTRGRSRWRSGRRSASSAWTAAC